MGAEPRAFTRRVGRYGAVVGSVGAVCGIVDSLAQRANRLSRSFPHSAREVATAYVSAQAGRVNQFSYGEFARAGATIAVVLAT